MELQDFRGELSIFGISEEKRKSEKTVKKGESCGKGLGLEAFTSESAEARKMDVSNLMNSSQWEEKVEKKGEEKGEEMKEGGEGDKEKERERSLKKEEAKGKRSTTQTLETVKRPPSTKVVESSRTNKLPKKYKDFCKTKQTFEVFKPDFMEKKKKKVGRFRQKNVKSRIENVDLKVKEKKEKQKSEKQQKNEKNELIKKNVKRNQKTENAKKPRRSHQKKKSLSILGFKTQKQSLKKILKKRKPKHANKTQTSKQII